MLPDVLKMAKVEILANSVSVGKDHRQYVCAGRAGGHALRYHISVMLIKADL